jgi:hypothetical protein
MHDVDRTTLETSTELFEYGGAPLASEQYEYPGEWGEYGGSGTVLGEIFGEVSEGPFEAGYQELPEIMEDEFASALLEVRSDQELDHFLGSFIKKAVGTIGKALSSPVGQALGGVLKQVAKKALPIAGGALGTFLGGPAGGLVGSKLASMAGDVFGLEYEGLSPEDRDFEVARRFVRFAGHAAKRAARAPRQMPPRAAAKAAVVEAARRYAPGLLAPRTDVTLIDTGEPGFGEPSPPVTEPGYEPMGEPDTSADAGAEPACACGAKRMRQGRWIRRGRHIVLLGV